MPNDTCTNELIKFKVNVKVKWTDEEGVLHLLVILEWKVYSCHIFMGLLV